MSDMGDAADDAGAVDAAWFARRDPSSKQLYYHNVVTGETTWVCPRGVTARLVADAPSNGDNESEDDEEEEEDEQQQEQREEDGSKAASASYGAPPAPGSEEYAQWWAAYASHYYAAMMAANAAETDAGASSSSAAALSGVLDRIDASRESEHTQSRASASHSEDGKAKGKEGILTAERDDASLYTDYTVRATFNARTNRMQSNVVDVSAAANAAKQLNAYFDFEAWQAEMAARGGKAHAKLTKKQLGKVIKRAKEKKEWKKKEWLLKEIV